MEFDLAIVVLKAGMGSPVPKGDVETLLNTPGIGSVSRAYKRPPPGSNNTESTAHHSEQKYNTKP